MPSPHKHCELRITLPATQDAVEQFFVDFREQVQSELPQEHRFSAELLAREALNNAVLHGCQADPTKHIHCIFRLKGRCLIIAVEDCGEGFNWRAAWRRTAELSATSGRGIGLLRSLATRVRFNDKGNAVVIIKQCR